MPSYLIISTGQCLPVCLAQQLTCRFPVRLAAPLSMFSAPRRVDNAQPMSADEVGSPPDVGGDMVPAGTSVDPARGATVPNDSTAEPIEQNNTVSITGEQGAGVEGNGDTEQRPSNQEANVLSSRGPGAQREKVGTPAVPSMAAETARKPEVTQDVPPADSGDSNEEAGDSQVMLETKGNVTNEEETKELKKQKKKGSESNLLGVRGGRPKTEIDSSVLKDRVESGAQGVDQGSTSNSTAEKTDPKASATRTEGAGEGKKTRKNTVGASQGQPAVPRSPVVAPRESLTKAKERSPGSSDGIRMPAVDSGIAADGDGSPRSSLLRGSSGNVTQTRSPGVSDSRRSGHGRRSKKGETGAPKEEEEDPSPLRGKGISPPGPKAPDEISATNTTNAPQSINPATKAKNGPSRKQAPVSEVALEEEIDRRPLKGANSTSSNGPKTVVTDTAAPAATRQQPWNGPSNSTQGVDDPSLGDAQDSPKSLAVEAEDGIKPKKTKKVDRKAKPEKGKSSSDNDNTPVEQSSPEGPDSEQPSDGNGQMTPPDQEDGMKPKKTKKVDRKAKPEKDKSLSDNDDTPVEQSSPEGPDSEQPSDGNGQMTPPDQEDGMKPKKTKVDRKAKPEKGKSLSDNDDTPVEQSSPEGPDSEQPSDGNGQMTPPDQEDGMKPKKTKKVDRKAKPEKGKSLSDNDDTPVEQSSPEGPDSEQPSDGNGQMTPPDQEDGMKPKKTKKVDRKAKPEKGKSLPDNDDTPVEQSSPEGPDSEQPSDGNGQMTPPDQEDGMKPKKTKKVDRKAKPAKGGGSSSDEGILEEQSSSEGPDSRLPSDGDSPMVPKPELPKKFKEKSKKTEVKDGAIASEIGENVKGERRKNTSKGTQKAGDTNAIDEEDLPEVQDRSLPTSGEVPGSSPSMVGQGVEPLFEVPNPQSSTEFEVYLGPWRECSRVCRNGVDSIKVRQGRLPNLLVGK